MLRGKIVLVTGGSSGISYHLARAFRAAGAYVVIAGLDGEPCAEGLPGVAWLQCDMTDCTQARRLLRDMEVAYGRIDILVNNPESFGALSVSADCILPSELIASMTLSTLAMPLLRAAQRPTIVMVSNGESSSAGPESRAARAGLHAFAKAMRRHLRPSGVQIIETPLPCDRIFALLGASTASPERLAALTVKAVRQHQMPFDGPFNLLALVKKFLRRRGELKTAQT